MTGEFTGKHMAMAMVAGFGIVVAVNLVMASLASSTFGGVVVENSYVASQEFNGWLDKAEQARELGWEVSLARGADGRLLVTTGDLPATAVISAVARHPLGHLDDRALRFARNGTDTYVSSETLPEGRWTVRLEVRADGETWRSERDLR